MTFEGEKANYDESESDILKPMLLGKDLILATRQFAKEQRAKSWSTTLSTVFLVVLFLSLTFITDTIYVRVLLSVISGLLLVRLFVIYHDYQHHTILNRSKAAEWLMTLVGIYMLAPASIWKRSHDHHHSHNSRLLSAHIGSFPIVTKSQYLLMTKRERLIYLATRHPITIGLGYFTMFLMGMCVSSFASSPKKHFDSLIALVIHLTVATLLFWAFGWQTWFFVFCVPFLVAFAIGTYLFYAQHNFPGVDFYESKSWVYEKAALESSSYMQMNPVMAWFTGNIGYHHIHHLNSKIPFYRLPEVMRQFPELRCCKTTSLSPKQIIACLRLKIWDSDRNQMVGVKGLK